MASNDKALICEFSVLHVFGKAGKGVKYNYNFFSNICQAFETPLLIGLCIC